jgi:hypothetical protein
MTGNALVTSVYCHQIVQDGQVLTSLAEIGLQSVIDLGITQAVDIYGLQPNGVPVVFFETPLHICLRGSGEVLFINAATSARTVQRLPVTIEGDYRCVDVASAGTLVMVSGSSGLVEPIPTATSFVSMKLTGQCYVTVVSAPLNLRAEPSTSAAILAQLPYDLMLTATERTPGWYRVIYLDGQGWVNASYINAIGDCGS